MLIRCQLRHRALELHAGSYFTGLSYFLKDEAIWFGIGHYFFFFLIRVCSCFDVDESSFCRFAQDEIVDSWIRQNDMDFIFYDASHDRNSMCRTL